MGMLTPSHIRRVKLYRADVPLFHHYGVEVLDALHNPVINLPSGGSVVIHVTEALTAIDVNRAARRGSATLRRPRSRPISKPRRKSPASSVCATSPGSS